MDDSNLTMEEYIELEAEKARRRAIIFDDPLGTDHKISSEPTGYTNEIVHDFEERLDMIFSKQVNRVHIFDFEGLTEEMRQGLTDRLRMVYTGAERHVLFTSYAWRRVFEILGPLSMIASDDDFSEAVPSYTSIRDPLRRLCHRLIAVSISGRGQAPEKVDYRGGPLGIDCGERQQMTAAGAAQVDEEIPDEGVQADPAPAQGPPTAAPIIRTMPQSMTRLEEEVHRLRESLGEQRAVLDGMSRDFSRFITWTVGRLSQLLDVSRVAYPSYGDPHTSYHRRTRRRTGEASTSAAPHTNDQPNP
ncbi:hypothetical protein Tco_0722461 [Tanacetum coccineum]